MSLEKRKPFVVIHSNGGDFITVEACHFGITDGCLVFWGEKFLDGPVAAFAAGNWDRVGLPKE